MSSRNRFLGLNVKDLSDVHWCYSDFNNIEVNINSNMGIIHQHLLDGKSTSALVRVNLDGGPAAH